MGGRVIRSRLIVWRGVAVPSYTVMLTMACVGGTYAGLGFAVATGMPATRTLLAIVLLLAVALIGARLWFVLAHRSQYDSRARDAFRRSQGGSGLYGGLTLAFAVSVPVLWLLQLPFWRFWDAATVTMLVGLPITRFGCLANGCCAGRPTAGPIALHLPGAGGIWQRRVPTQLLEAAWTGLILLAVLLLRSHLGPGGCLALAAALYGAGRLTLEPLREQSGARLANMVVSSSLLALGVLGLAIWGAG
jgi:phosphatidylglycerol:prolipoprotein diacylglycerol transferase